MKLNFFIFLFFVFNQILPAPYLTVVGPICFPDGIGRQSISIMECLKNDIEINFMSSRNTINIEDVPSSIKSIIKNPSHVFGQIMIFEDTLDYFPSVLEHTPSSIKIAYTMYEKTQLPSEWVEILNSYFDAAIVPDEFLVDVYKNSGVIIPIFVLPLSLYLEPFLEIPAKTQANFPFIFGTSGMLSDRKNQLLLLEAFEKTFGNSPDVKLKIHGRSGFEYAKRLKERIDQLKLTNVELIDRTFTWIEYIEFMASLDCFVSVSRGEGFSIPPREALALGIPCIISDNTGHQTLCKTGFVKAIPSYKLENVSINKDYSSSSFRNNYYQLHEPYEFECSLNSVCLALKDTFFNFVHYLKEAIIGRKWASQFVHDELKEKYLTLIKPKKVILGLSNKITNGSLITDSKTLYEKYLQVINVQSP
ncbi:MAG: glycosyltransferase family 4 protein [Candidatus Babeliales bacterium]